MQYLTKVISSVHTQIVVHVTRHIGFLSLLCITFMWVPIKQNSSFQNICSLLYSISQHLFLHNTCHFSVCSWPCIWQHRCWWGCPACCPTGYSAAYSHTAWNWKYMRVSVVQETNMLLQKAGQTCLPNLQQSLHRGYTGHGCNSPPLSPATSRSGDPRFQDLSATAHCTIHISLLWRKSPQHAGRHWDTSVGPHANGCEVLLKWEGCHHQCSFSIELLLLCLLFLRTLTPCLDSFFRYIFRITSLYVYTVGLSRDTSYD